jgi:hypothetical protein
MRWEGQVGRAGESSSAYRVQAEKPERKGPLGMLRRRWEDNIKMDLPEIERVTLTGLI